MGLDTSHNCWHGSYSSFNAFREAVCEAAGLGNLDDYKGFGGEKDWLKPEHQPLNTLLNHSDCEGVIKHKHCKPLADALEEVFPKLSNTGFMPTQFRRRQFINGLLADKNQEDVDFH